MTEIHQRLLPVRRRQRWDGLLRAAMLGLLASGVPAIALATVRLAGVSIAWWLPLLTAVCGLAAGLALGTLIPLDWRHAAAAVDSSYRLKDRTATALEFLSQPQADVLQRLQIDDALEHLRQVDPRRVTPLRAPPALPWALSLLLAVWLLTLLPPMVRRPAAAATADPVVLREVEKLQQELLSELRRIPQEQQGAKTELERLVAELNRQIDQLKQPGVNQADALSALSEMQATLAQAQRQLNLEVVEDGLRQLADAIWPAAALQAAAQALQDGRYQDAANQLENLEASQLPSTEAQTVAEELSQLAESMRQTGQEKLSETARQMSEGLRNQDREQTEQAAESLAKQARDHGQRQEISQQLAGQIAALTQSKASLAANTNGGQGVAKSDSPKTTWGQGASNQPLGQQATQIETTRQRQDITGALGEGPSESETSRSAEGRQTASRTLQEKLQQYHKQNEAVMLRENLPLGHRQTIRRYFESIRPDSVDASDAMRR